MVLPLMSFMALAVVSLLTFAGVIIGKDVGADGGVELGSGDYLILAFSYFVTYAIGIFFNAAIVGAATIRLNGGDPTVRDGLRLASGKIGKILAWAAIAATVGMILRAVEERAPLAGKIVLWLVGAAWNAITFLVVPVLLFEPLGVTDSIKRSGSLFKERWGEQFVGNAAIGLVMFLFALPVLGVSVLLMSAGIVALGVIIAVAGIGVLMAAGGALSGIFNAALYQYATTGEAHAAFSAADFQATFHRR